MKPRILILDDQAMYGRSLDRVLRGDYEVTLAKTCSEARELAHARFDVALVDIRLDEKNPEDRGGLGFVKRLRANGCQMPIVAMSALEDEALEQQATDAGATCFLRKPIIISQLRELLLTLTHKQDG